MPGPRPGMTKREQPHLSLAERSTGNWMRTHLAFARCYGSGEGERRLRRTLSPSPILCCRLGGDGGERQGGEESGQKRAGHGWVPMGLEPLIARRGEKARAIMSMLRPKGRCSHRRRRPRARGAAAHGNRSSATPTRSSRFSGAQPTLQSRAVWFSISACLATSQEQ